MNFFESAGPGSKVKVINRICISINNICNLNCRYCHFHEKGVLQDAPMDIFVILDNVMRYANHDFKIGFVGNGEPLLNIDDLKAYLTYIEDNKRIHTYIITNGTIDIGDENWLFLEKHNVNVGFSLDGYKELHDLYRCNSYEEVVRNVERYKRITGHYPTFNATVGKESLENAEKLIDYFMQFGSRVTFSRMIGRYGISLSSYRDFIKKAEKRLNVRHGGLDCTMYGGSCGAGINNYFFANGNIYFCGNCVDIPPVADSSTSFAELEKIHLDFNRNLCWKEQQ